jgi:hypothetical protein
MFPKSIMNKKNIKLPSNRKFGYFFSIIFILAGLYFFYKNQLIFYLLFFSLFLIFLVFSIFKPNKLQFLNRLWMQFGYVIGKIMSPVVLGIIFFGLFFPISLIFKLLRRDELKMAKIKNKSLWKYRLKNANYSKQFKLQF